MTEYQILSALKNNGGSMEFTALLNLNMTDTHRDGIADEERIKNMIKDKLLRGNAEAFGVISITKPGRLHLQNAQYLNDKAKQISNEASDKEAKQNRNNWLMTVVGAVIAGIVGLAFELISLFL